MLSPTAEDSLHDFLRMSAPFLYRETHSELQDRRG